MFASFRDAPPWAQTRNPAPCTALDSRFVHSALLNERPGMTESKTAGILRSRALARCLEGWPQVLVAHPSRLAVKNGEHLRMTARCVRPRPTPRDRQTRWPVRA